MSADSLSGQGVSSARGLNPGIQGMRGLAILLVLLNHAEVPGFGGGFVGVDIFFVISGFLIGGLLQRELESTGRLDLWAFFARRIRRLLPSSLLVVAFSLLVVRLFYAPQEQDELLSSVRAAALYAVNLWFSSRTTDYFGGHTEANPVLHLWSLAVEEQFYILWPLLLLAAVRLTHGAVRQAHGALIVGLGLLSLAGCIAMSMLNYKHAFFLTPFRIWEFAAGMAVMSWSHRAAHWPVRVPQVLGLLALVLLVVVSLSFNGRMRFPGAWAMLPVSSAVLLLLVTLHAGDSLAGRLLEAAPLRWLGDCSYSVYLWHWPLFIIATQLVPHPGAALTLLLLVGAILLGRVSYRCVEQPFMRAPREGGSNRLVVCLGLGLCIALAMAAQWSRGLVRVGEDQARFLNASRWDEMERTDCLVSATVVDQPPCEFGHAEPRATVVLYGDSHASQWYLPLMKLAHQHQLRLVVLTKTACPSADVPVAVYTTLNAYTECDVWRERMLQRIQTLKPAVLVLANSSGYGIAPSRWQSGLDRTLQRFQEQGLRIAYIRDIPFPGFDVPVCHARTAWRGWAVERTCTYEAAAEQARIGDHAAGEAEVVRRHGGVYVDLSASICAGEICPTLRDGMILFKDRNHLSEAFALSLAPQLEPVLVGLLGEAASSAR